MLALTTALIAMGCESDAIGVAHSNNTNVKIERLAVTDGGCTIYRFNDGNYHYFVLCNQGSVSMIDGRHSAGKTTVPDGDEPVALNR